jgi:hypothetical protein
MEPGCVEHHLCLHYWLGLMEVTDEEVEGAEVELDQRLAAAEARGGVRRLRYRWVPRWWRIWQAGRHAARRRVV